MIDEVRTVKQGERKQILTAALIAIIILLIMSCAAGYSIYSINRSQLNEAQQYLDEVTGQYHNTIMKQIEGDLQTLSSLCTFIGNEEGMTNDRIMNILEIENYNNDFIRMGIVTPDGMGTFVDMDGTRHEDIYIGDEPFIQRAFEGTFSISDTMKDTFSGGYIIGYAIPLYRDGNITAVLTAVNKSSTYASIIDQPIFHGDGFLHIVKQNGDFVIRSNHQMVPELTNATSIYDERLLLDIDPDVIAGMRSGAEIFSQFTYQNIEYWLYYSSIGENGWYTICMVPQTSINGNFVRLTVVFVIIFVLNVLMFTVLFLFIYRTIRNSQNVMRTLAYYDPLTGLYNKFHFCQLSAEKIQKKGHFVLILLDVDNFRFINDLFGFDKGDRLLIEIGRILTAELSDNEICCRDTSDKFALLLNEHDVIRIKERIRHIKNLLNSYRLEDLQDYSILCRSGACIITAEDVGGGMDVIWDRAALALRNAKKDKSEEPEFYNDQLKQKEQKRSMIELNMQSALDNREFKMYLQPKVDLSNYEVIGAEALVRWIRPGGDMIYPDEFIPLFEQNGFITRLDMYMLEEACRFLAEMNHSRRRFRIAVNQSRIVFYTTDYMKQIRAMIEQYQVDPHSIILEITEGIIVENLEEMKQRISELHAIGFEVSMDDFGSGYSSLNILKELDIDELKLDRIFLSDTHETVRRDSILKNVINLARDLHISTVAEGVELWQQSEFLRSVQCDCGQGYYYARPIPSEEFYHLPEYLGAR